MTSTGQITVAADIEDAPKRVFSHYREGTGAIGGWEKSELRTYYYDTLLPLIPENIKAQLKAVLKNQPALDTMSNQYIQTTEEKVCPPSYIEMFKDSSATNQPRYKALFSDDASRIKKKYSTTKAVSWPLRSTYTNFSFGRVLSNGSYWYECTNAQALPLCFFT